ncbi:mandelate racemase/muconate lactonizing enzyme family protein [Halopenitus sp. H-Gu1]|uniref:mandelate racemase/muconate lactonizing enzyme family protein n=1 Tax=Halopenitus sp. H-Gu1 TaxID=3242697 RepID=UPI00359DAABE
MKITDINTHLVESDAPISEYGVNGWLIVTVTTDDGIRGIGEAGAWAYLETAEKAVERFTPQLIGEDPLQREHHLQSLYRSTHFRGAAISSALSAIDIALWDIAGKHYDTPIYELLGGKCRNKLRTYAHVIGGSMDEMLGKLEDCKGEGFTAVGHLSPLLDEPRDEPYSETHSEMITDAADRVRRFRDAVGTGVDLCIEIHRRLDPHQAIALANEIEQYNPLFYEDPVRPDNFDAMKKVARNVSIPIATGERFHTPEEFDMLLRHDAVDYVRPDLCVAGGITWGKKIASMAEASYVDVVPHDPIGPVSTAACMQLAASIPNFEIQEYPYRPENDQAPGENLLEEPFEWEDGYLMVPDGPGLGIELQEDVLQNSTYRQPKLSTRLHEDGSVVDQ